MTGSSQEVLRGIQQRERFVLTSHARPDGDAIGSVLACAEVVRQIGKHAEVVLSDGVPVIYRRLPFAERVRHATSLNGEFEAAILLECDSIERSRVDGLERHFLINIDHHLSGKQFAHINWIDPSACATAEIIYRLAREAGVSITPEIATCLYAAVLTDTGSFAYANTGANTFALAEELVRAGADPVRIAQAVYFSNPTSKMRLLGAALSNLHRDGALAWMFITRADVERSGAMDEDAEGLVNYSLGIQGIEVAVFFRELADGRFRVSLRSKGRVNVAHVAARYGGGGHHCASGFPITGPLSVAAERVLAQLRMELDKIGA
jgi:phosphoesterase RecJ-like protein